MTTDAEIIALLRAGRTNEDVALELGVGSKRVRRLRQEHAIAHPGSRGRRALDDRQSALAHRLHEHEGLSWAAIGRRLGCADQVAAEAAKRYQEGRA